MAYFDRLLILADYLEKLPPKPGPSEPRFSFSSFVGLDWKGAQDLSCGTCACAIGLCPLIPEFQGLGLRYAWARQERHGVEDEHPVYIACSPWARGALPEVLSPGDGIMLGEDRPSIRTAMWLFDLTLAQAVDLFVPHDYIMGGDNNLGDDATPNEVAAHIRHFVDTFAPTVGT